MFAWCARPGFGVETHFSVRFLSSALAVRVFTQPRWERIYSRRLHFKRCRCIGCTGLFANEFASTTLRKSRDHTGTCGSEACPRYKHRGLSDKPQRPYRGQASLPQNRRSPTGPALVGRTSEFYSDDHNESNSCSAFGVSPPVCPGSSKVSYSNWL